MIFEHLNLKPHNPYLSLALEEAFCLYLSREKQIKTLGGIRLWASPPSIILGRTCDVFKNIKDHTLIDSFAQGSFFDHKKFHLCRRLSGGGTVLHGSGNINYSIYLSASLFPHLYNVNKTYEQLLSTVIKALANQGIHARQKGLSDLVINKDGVDYKISGNSQFRKHGTIVLHGTLITRHEFINSIGKYLLHPPKEPDYRQGRNHSTFLGALPDHFEIASFYQCFRSEVMEITGAKTPKPILLSDLCHIYSEAKVLCREIYTKPDWVIHADGKTGRKVKKSKVAHV